mgnify:CR=1 FL=1
MPVDKKISRRQALKQGLAAAAAGIAVPYFVSCRQPDRAPARAKPRPSPNDQIGVGIIGCGRRNGQLAIGKGFQGKPPANARFVAVADLNLRRAKVWAKYYKCKAYQDYRELLDRKEVDVVVYATPEHWHYLPCIHACQAGKDIYGEQPLSHTIREGRVMVEAVRKYKRVFQTGEQQRSHPKTRKAVLMLAQEAPYQMYDRQKVVTELEWGLLQAQVRLTTEEAYLTFDSLNQRFDMIVWITTVDAARQSTQFTRDSFEATVDLAKAVLEMHFPEFKARRSKDIQARLLLGRSGGEELAVFDGSSVRFSDKYYEYLKEVGRR